MNMEVVGRHALLFDDDASAGFVNSDAALVEWNSLLIDRYDVRHLLSAPPPSRKRRNLPPLTAPADLDLDYERYLDLPPPVEQQESDEAANQANTGEYNAVAFSYNMDHQNNKEPELESPAFHPTFPIPESLLQNLPQTEKVHQIIARTAMFVSKHGGQSEIVLRVKQGNNPAFGFLMPDDHLHGYFRYLVDHQELLRSDVDEKPQREEKQSNGDGGGALSLLGSMYGYDEDEDEDAEKSKNKSEKTESRSSKEAAPSVHVPPTKEKSNTLRNSSKPESSSGTTKKDEEKPRASSLPAIPKIEPVIIEPPSDLKRLVDKIVEFIIKNGKQFEAVLVEQDIGHARFPFLLPYNQYHSYYLKVLERAQQPKIPDKSTRSSEKHKDRLERKSRSGVSKESDTHSQGSAGSDIPHNTKEKFKMVLPNKSKKEEGPDQSSRETKPVGVGVDAASVAAILQAATRGIKNPNIGFLYKNQDQSDRKSGQNCASEVDSSEAHMTREQKLKAERLKRAKLFVTKLKSEKSEEPSRGLSVEPQQSTGVNFAAKETEREGSSVPFKFDHKNGKIHSGDEDESEHRSKRNYRSRSSRHGDDDDDEDDDDKRSRKKRHRSHRSSHDDKHSRKKHHRSHRDESDHADDKKHRSHKDRHRKRHVHDDDDDTESSKSRRDKHQKERKEGSADLSSLDHQDTTTAPAASEVTVIPDDLRAKIRAMLKATM